MLDRCYRKVQSLLFGCLACLVLTSVVNADGRVFVLDLRNSSGLQGFRDAQQACASQHARLASTEELRHAVVECFFSPCTRGWLHGGKVGTTVCNIVGSTLKAVDVRMENSTDVTAHLDAFCIKDKDVPCGDPPSFPNARLQGHSGFEMGDELLYTCVPGYVMPSGQSAFSLLCDSCGEWYGLVQICVRDQTEGHVDYEDKFIDSHGAAERSNERPEEAHGEVLEEVHPDEHGDIEVVGEVIDQSRAFEGDRNEERAVEDFIGHPRWEQEMTEVARTDTAAATEAPVSLLSQKHMFWFPSEAFQVEGSPVVANPVVQTTQRASGAQSEESKELKSQESHDEQHPADVDDERDGYDDHDSVDRDDGDDSRHDSQDIQDSHYDEDDRDSHDVDPDEDDSRHHEDVKHPAQLDDLDTQERRDDDNDHDDHYDMGEHEEDNDRVRYGSREFDDGDDTHSEQEIYEDHDDATDDRDEDGEHPEGSEEQSEYDDRDDHDDREDGQELPDTDEDDHHDHDHDDHEHKEDERYDDPDSHEDDYGRQHEIFSIGANERQNFTQKETSGKATTDETWLDGYPVVQEETEDDSTTERGSVARATDTPNEVEIRKPGPHTISPEESALPTVPELEQDEVEESWPGFMGTSAPAGDLLDPSDSPSFSDTLDYDTQQAAPTHSWLGDLTEDPFLDHGLAPPVQDNDDAFPGVIEEHTVRNLPGETGDRGEVEGEMEETICVGDECPPNTPSTSSRGPTVAAIIVAVCAVATAVIVGVWCYQRRQRKSSMYEMNGKGQSQSRQAQQIEMQQKV
ncbi:unnamed protein product [Ophioblennius macclurei]